MKCLMQGFQGSLGDNLNLKWMIHGYEEEFLGNKASFLNLDSKHHLMQIQTNLEKLGMLNGAKMVMKALGLI